MHNEHEIATRADEKPIKQTWEWIEERARHPRAVWWLGWYSFLETVLLPVPTDIFLAIMVLANRARAAFLTLVTTVTSIAGAAIGYWVAAFFFTLVAAPLISFFGMEDAVLGAAETLQGYTFIAIFLGAFTPFPYTPVVFAAGFLRVDFVAFIAASIAGRSIRYAIVALLTLVFGSAVLAHLSKLSRRSVLITTVLILAAFLVYALFVI